MFLLALIALIALAALRFWGADEIVARFGPGNGWIAIHSIGIALSVVAALFIDQFVRLFYWQHYLHRGRGVATPALFKDILTIVLVVIGLSIGLSIEEGLSVTGLITASSATAVVLGFALQVSIQDLFSGLAVHLDSSYALGDWLTVYTDQVPEPQYGRVTGITWRSTFLTLEDGRRLMVPNHLMTANPVLNHSRPNEPKRLTIIVPVDNRVPTERVVDMFLGEIYKLLRRPGFAREPDPDVLVQSIDKDSVHYELRFYIWPNNISPTKAHSIAMMAALQELQKNDIPTPVTLVELTQHPNLEYILGDEEKRGALARSPLFADVLDASELDTLAKSCSSEELARGAVLMRQGDPPSSMYIILEGAVSIAIPGDGGTMHEVAISAAGDVVGEMSLMTGANRNATATTLARLRVLKIEKSDIEGLLKSNPELAERFAATLARRQRELDETAHRAARRESQEDDILSRMKSFFARAFA